MIPELQIGGLVAMYFDQYDLDSGFIGKVEIIEGDMVTIRGLGSLWRFNKKYGDFGGNYSKYVHVTYVGPSAYGREPTVFHVLDPVAFLMEWSKGKFNY
jgi:hypothetical protein